MMNSAGTLNAVQKIITVRCTMDVAFRTWTEQIDAWWPKTHSRSGNANTTVTLEQGAGGRLFERTADGVEHTWGQVVSWTPPQHFACDWYLGSGQERPSRVDVHFIAQADGHTRVEVIHRGPELIGELWSRNCHLYDQAWATVLTHYLAACAPTL
jgi:hypothetical protein